MPDQEPMNIAGERGRQHKQCIDRLAVEIEKQAGDQQQEVFKFKRDNEIKQQDYGEKVVQEADTGKKQSSSLLFKRFQ